MGEARQIQARQTEAPAKRIGGSLPRTMGILVLAASLVGSLSGSIALAPTFTPADLPDAQRIEPGQADEGPGPDTDGRVPFRTGDRLDAEQRAAFAAYVHALKAEGKHRGPAFYTSW